MAWVEESCPRSYSRPSWSRGEDQVHDGLGVQRVGGAGDVGQPVEAGAHRVGDSRVDDRDVGILHGGQHGGSRGGSHRHDDVHIVGHEVGADLVQVGLVRLRVGIVVGVIEGDAALGPGLVQTGLQRGDDLVQGSVVHVVDHAHLVHGAGRLAGSGRGGGGRRGSRPAAGQRQRGTGGCSGSGGLEETAAGDHLGTFHRESSFLVWGAEPNGKGPPRLRCGTGPDMKTTRPCVYHKDRIETFDSAVPPCLPCIGAEPLAGSQHSPAL